MHNNNKLKIVTQVFASFSVQVLQNLFVAQCALAGAMIKDDNQYRGWKVVP